MSNINKVRLATLLVIGMLFAGGTASYAWPLFGNAYSNGYNGYQGGYGGYGGGYNNGFVNRMFNGGNMYSGYNMGGMGGMGGMGYPMNGGCGWHHHHHRHGWGW